MRQEPIDSGFGLIRLVDLIEEDRHGIDFTTGIGHITGKTHHIT